MPENTSRLFRGPKVTNKSTEEPCQKGSTDCMYLTPSGGCAAEWCIYAELPKMVSGSRELTCSVCGINKKTVSMYSGTTSYICPECQEKIKKVTPDEKLCSVCKTNKVAVDQYICIDCQTKLITVIKDPKCAICGTSVSVGEYICQSCRDKIKSSTRESACPICGANTGIGGSICSSCASKIKEKLNE